MTAWTAESLPPELAAILDEQAGKTHSPAGAVRRCLADVLNAYDELRDRPDPATEYGGDLAAPLCCCKRGSMCASCGTRGLSDERDRLRAALAELLDTFRGGYNNAGQWQSRSQWVETAKLDAWRGLIPPGPGAML